MNEEEKTEQEDKKEESEGDRFIPTEQREAVDSTRRDGEERRQEDKPGNKPFEGVDRRQTIDRRDSPDRRGMRFGVIYKTVGSMTEIEDWLDDTCDGEWNLILQDMDDQLVQKTLRVMFELEEDKKKFVELYARGIR